jgi:hypothetical protein
VPRPKQVPVQDRKTVHIYYVSIPYVAVTASGDPNLTGLYGVGPNNQAALSNFRSVVRRTYPHTTYDIVEHGEGID